MCTENGQQYLGDNILKIRHRNKNMPKPRPDSPLIITPEQELFSEVLYMQLKLKK